VEGCSVCVCVCVCVCIYSSAAWSCQCEMHMSVCVVFWGVCAHAYWWVCVCVCVQAALRRLAAGCPDSIEANDHQQLIKPRLVDSFLLCSNMEESFVWRRPPATHDVAHDVAHGERQRAALLQNIASTSCLENYRRRRPNVIKSWGGGGEWSEAVWTQHPNVHTCVARSDHIECFKKKNFLQNLKNVTRNLYRYNYLWVGEIKWKYNLFWNENTLYASAVQFILLPDVGCLRTSYEWAWPRGLFVQCVVCWSALYGTLFIPFDVKYYICHWIMNIYRNSLGFEYVHAFYLRRITVVGWNKGNRLMFSVYCHFKFYTKWSWNSRTKITGEESIGWGRGRGHQWINK